MRRFFFLLRFEIKKVLSQKKAFLFLLALNIVPILASIFALLIFIKLKSWGFEKFQYSLLVQAIRGLFTAHIKFFAFISPFFLSLVVGDSFSGESGRGYLKTLLLTPVARWQVITCKALAILLFLIIAISLGGFFLQMDLWVARALSQSPSMEPDLPPDQSSRLVDTSTAIRLLLVSFIINITLVGFFILFSLFFDSPIIMTFCSLILLLALQTYVLIAPTLGKILDPGYEKFAKFCFTRHLSELADIDTVTRILEKKASLFSGDLFFHLWASMAWTAAFFTISFIVFQRKQILN